MTDRCRAVRGGRAGARVEKLSDSGQLTDNNPRRLVVTALVPPRPALDPPAILALIVEKHTTPSAHVVFQLYGEVLLHTHLDCADPPLVPGRTGLFYVFAVFAGLIAGSKVNDVPFMQYLRPVGRGPSSNTCPRCPLHRAQWTSARTIPCVLSIEVSTASGTGAEKLGQPVPLSNFASDLNNSWPHPAQRNTPDRCSLFNGLVPARSVPCFRSTWNCSAVSLRRHSSSVAGMSFAMSMVQI